MTRKLLCILIPTLSAGLALSGLAACGDDDGGQNDNDNDNGGSAICGNGELETGEQCDDGAQNSDVAPDACRTDCRSPFCGDGITDGDEECDDGAANSNRLANACRTDCQLPHCGDSVVDPGETCDDGNANDGDGCGAACQVEPSWTCDGVPSVCRCARYHAAADCGKCVIYVDIDNDSGAEDGESWSTAFTSIQIALDTAYAHGPGCEVWVAEGRYAIHVHSQRDTVMLRSGVGFYGNFSGDETERNQRWGSTTILSGEGGPHDLHAYHVVTAFSVQDATMDGFTVSGGFATGAGVDELGGGLLVVSSDLLVQNVTIQASSATQGGGLYAWDSDLELRQLWLWSNDADLGGAVSLEQSRVVIDDCLFQENRANVDGGGAIHDLNGESLLITDSAFTQNRAAVRGGAIHSFDGQVEIEGSSFERNTAMNGSSLAVGGAVSGHIQRISDSVFLGNLAYTNGGALSLERVDLIERSSFLGNSAEDGIGGALRVYLDSTTRPLRVESCLFAGNSAFLQGGAIYLDADSPLELVSSTVARNEVLDTLGEGGGLYAESQADATLINAIVWGNEESQAPPVLNVTAFHSIAEDPSYGGANGNPSGDPGWSVAQTGKWTAVEVDYNLQMLRLTDSGANWTPGALVGAVIHYGDSGNDFSPIADNTATEILLRYGADHRTQVDGDYAIHDLRLPAGSPALDAGMGSSGGFTVPALDLLGNPRVDDAATDTGTGTPTYVDLGCYERQ